MSRLKLFTLTAVLVLTSTMLFSQSQTTKDFSDAHEEAFTMFFYKNTLRMWLQDVEEYEALIRDIDKMKFIRIEKSKYKFDKDDFKNIKSKYHEEQFEDLMSMRHEGMNVTAYIQEDDGITTGIVLLMNDEQTFSILDIKGRVPLDKIGKIISEIQKLN